MAMRKKGVLFTIVSIILVTTLIFFYISITKTSFGEKSKVIETRISTMDNFIFDIEEDVQRGLYISAIRSLVGISEYMSENGTFLANFNDSFNEIMLNGTINNNFINITEGANFKTWMNKVEDIAYKLDIDLNFHNLSVTANQVSPWDIKINVHGVMNLTDRKKLAAWYRDINISTILNIEEFEDPLYTIATKGKFTNTIMASNITDFVDGSDATNLKTHINNSWYIESVLAPSFIMRFSGNLNASLYGIESVVNIVDLQASAPEYYESSTSTIDYQYFGNLTISNCQVNETLTEIDWFRLDAPHLIIYESTCS